MKIFERKFKELPSALDTWIVEWKTYFDNGIVYPSCTTKYKAFGKLEDAEEFKEQIILAKKIIGIQDTHSPKVYQQEKISFE